MQRKEYRSVSPSVSYKKNDGTGDNCTYKNTERNRDVVYIKASHVDPHVVYRIISFVIEIQHYAGSVERIRRRILCGELAVKLFRRYGKSILIGIGII